VSAGGVELSAFCGGVLWFLWVAAGRLHGGPLELSPLLRALLLSCYGKVLLIPAVIWEHDYSPLCLGLIKLFVLTSNSQAIRGERSRRFEGPVLQRRGYNPARKVKELSLARVSQTDADSF